MHSAKSLEHSDKTNIVVFIHGYMGSPRQFDRLAEVAYNEGYSALSLLLPGHGSGTKEFSKATMAKWQEHVNSEVECFSKKYQHIFLVGHSMGCLLAINAAVEYGEHVCGLFLIACPFKVSYINMAAIRVRLQQLFYQKTHLMKAAYHKGRSVPLFPNLLWRNIKPANELMKLTSFTKMNLHNVKEPITAIYSLADEVVSIKSLKILKSRATQTSVKSIVLTDSLHAYYTENEQALIEKTLLECIEKI